MNLRLFPAAVCCLLFISCKPELEIGLEIGHKAPALEYPSPTGKAISLSALEGQIVLIDFWASWCPPCRRENPHVVSAYQKYKDKNFKGGEGFTIYSISLDKNKEAWEKAILDDQLTWEAHVSDLNHWDSEGAEIYQVESIPSSYLIDGEGKILAKNLRGNDLHTFLENLTVKEE